MEYLVTTEEMRFYDRNTSEQFHIPSVVLMERAALACCQVLLQRQKKLEEAMASMGAYPGKKVLVVCGSGNNGGDGFAIGRLLMQEGFSVDFWLVGEKEKASELTKLQIAIIQAYGITVGDRKPAGEYDIMIDALFGIGLTRNLEGKYKEAVEYINASDAYVLSVDLPSGIHTDSGKVMGAAVHADVTVTFGFYKLGCFLYPGKRYAGQLICAPIGITSDSFLGRQPRYFTFQEPIEKLLPLRTEDGNKGTFGKVALLAGSEGMAGAAILAAEGAFSSGCGMVKLISPACNREIIQQTLPEAMFAEEIESVNKWADVIGAGCGLSTGENAVKKLKYIIEETKQTLILDADAIRILAENTGLLDRLTAKQQECSTQRKLILTPHPGELAALHGCTISEVLEHTAEIVSTWAKRLHAAVLCKGARTFVAAPDGRIYVNGSGNSGMATAGSGDVLTGIISAIAAQESDSFAAACIGVYLHGLAGDKAAHRLGEYSMKAGDIAAAVPEVIKP